MAFSVHLRVPPLEWTAGVLHYLLTSRLRGTFADDPVVVRSEEHEEHSFSVDGIRGLR